MIATTSHREEGAYAPIRKRLIRCLNRMRRRCLSPRSRDYPRYGGRGIQICGLWLSDPNAFVQWSFDNGYKPGLTIDRIDNDGGYSPDNCRWATKRLNNGNRSIKARATSRLHGVWSVRNSSRKWRAAAYINGKAFRLGTFLTEEEAGIAYDDFIFAHFGDPQLLNFPSRHRLASIVTACVKEGA